MSWKGTVTIWDYFKWQIFICLRHNRMSRLNDKNIFLWFQTARIQSLARKYQISFIWQLLAAALQKVHSWKSFPRFQFCVGKVFSHKLSLILNIFEIIWRMKTDRIARPKFIYSVCRTWRGREGCQSILRSLPAKPRHDCYSFRNV